MEDSDMHAWLSKKIAEKKDSLKFDWSPETRIEIENEIKELEFECAAYAPKISENNP